MNCELAHERIVTAAYGELPDNDARELDQHLATCSDCQTEREQLMALQMLAGTLPVAEPDANLVARARLRLDEALDALPPRHWYGRLTWRMAGSFTRLQAAPIAASVLLALGAGAGTFGGYEFAQHRATPVAPAASIASSGVPTAAPTSVTAVASTSNSDSDLSNVANISSITSKPDSEMVDVTYNQLVPRHMTGSLDDPAIRQLLMMGTENQISARVRGDSVGLLASECKIGHSCKPAGIREALITALRYDANPDVREKALAGLQPYIDQDVRVRDAVLEALMTDNDPRIRSAGIAMLTPIEADTSVRQVLNSVSTSDDNPHIRYVSRQILDQVPEIQ